MILGEEQSQETELGIHLGLRPPVAAGVEVEGLLLVLGPKRMMSGWNQDTWRPLDHVV